MGTKTNFYALLVCVISALFAGSGCTDKKLNTAKNKSELSDLSQSFEHKKVSIMLDWTPNTNHTGLYVALAKNFYGNEGLDVNIQLPVEGGPDLFVAANKISFGISSQENVTQARDQNIPIISIAAIIQHNTSGFAAPKNRQITSPKHFEKKTFGGWGSPVTNHMLRAIMTENNADPSKVVIRNVGTTDVLTALHRNHIDFTWLFYGWTGIEAELRGQPMDMVYIKDYCKNLDYYTPILITNEIFALKHPELVRAFLKGTAKGYEYAIQHPNEAAAILLEYVPELDRNLVITSQKWISPRYQEDAPQWGIQKQCVWENLYNWMHDRHLLEQSFDINQAFTNSFLPKCSLCPRPIKEQ